MKTLAVFCGSKDLPKEKNEELERFLGEFFSSVREKVAHVIYGGGKQGVMGSVRSQCEEIGLPISAYVLEKYRRPGDSENTKYFANHVDQVRGFAQEADAFLALPGGFGTVREILHVNEELKALKKEGAIYVPGIFTAFHAMVSELVRDGMVADEDLGKIVLADSPKLIRL